METKIRHLLRTLIMLTSLSILYACSNEEEHQQLQTDNRFEEFLKIGEEMHNYMLDGAKTFVTEMSKTRAETNDSIDIYERLHASLLTQVDTCKKLTTPEKKIWKAYMCEHKELYHEEHIEAQVGNSLNYKPNGVITSPIAQQFQYALEQGIIDSYELSILNRLMIYVIENKKQNASIQQLYHEVLNLKELWYKHYYNNPDKGNYSAMILAIAIKSCEWWIQNKDSLPAANHPSKIAPWAAADIAGAVIGTGTYIYVTHSCGGTLSWKNGIYSVAVSATIASSGIVAKTAKWIMTIF